MIFKIRFLGNVFRGENMAVKFIDGYSVTTRSYLIINSVSKTYSFASVCGIPIPKVT